MLDFEEEIKKFKPSLEVEDLDVYADSRETTDMMDILMEMMSQNER